VLREWNRKQILKRIAPEVILLWSKIDELDFSSVPSGTSVIYYEHGGAWFPSTNKRRIRYLDRTDGIICNSHASRRVLELQWNIQTAGRIVVCHNALRPDCLDHPPPPKKRNHNAPFRIGFAGRLVPLKGLASMIHAIAMLKENGLAVELHIAGIGPEQKRLLTCAEQLDIADRIIFHGFVNNMPNFFQSIDAFALPSIRESFGNAALEAMAFGCPVLGSRVDGLAEVVQNGFSGWSIKPSMSIRDYLKLGSASDGLPEFVYDPDNDSIVAPMALDPHDIAKGVTKWLNDDSLFEAMSQKAVNRAFTDFDFSRHVNCLCRAIESHCVSA
jgi:glycosyltransferase involved in cell wall biosynthesis